jgi:hypothetical protein
LPWSLGGRVEGTDFAQAWDNLPYPEQTPGLKMYSLVTMGYHVGGLVTHFLQPRKNDFAEMALHHIVSLFLFSGYYLSNKWCGGCAVAYLHDIADIGISASKMLSETRFSGVSATVFAFTMLVWLWTRLIILPFEIVPKIIKYYPTDEPNKVVMPCFIYLLGCMIMLHYFWFSIFC